MVRRATMRVPRTIAETMNRDCRRRNPDHPTNVPIFDEESHFSNGMMVVIQVHAQKEGPAESSAVLYEPADPPSDGFCEVLFEVGDDGLTGEYVLLSDGDEYIVTVESGEVEDITIEVKE